MIHALELACHAIPKLKHVTETGKYNVHIELSRPQPQNFTPAPGSQITHCSAIVLELVLVAG